MAPQSKQDDAVLAGGWYRYTLSRATPRTLSAGEAVDGEGGSVSVWGGRGGMHRMHGVDRGTTTTTIFLTTQSRSRGWRGWLPRYNSQNNLVQQEVNEP